MTPRPRVTEHDSAVTVSEMLDLIAQVPFSGLTLEALKIEHLSKGEVTIRYSVRGDPSLVRPGGTMSGPAMFALADLCAGSVVSTLKGKAALAVTTNMSLDFLRKPALRKDVIFHGQCLKDGARLVVSSVTIWTDGEEQRPVAHATVTYSVPPPGAKL